MAIFLNDQDERNCLVRTWFIRYLGRAPASAAEQTQWATAITTQGADLTLANLYDTQEAKNFRAKRGW